MIELQQNLWDVDADWYCVPTNAIVRKDGAAVMGRGVALDTDQKFPGIAYDLGNAIIANGSVVQPIYRWIWRYNYTRYIFAFPTKFHWRDRSPLLLIEQSCRQLLEQYIQVQQTIPWRAPKIVIPRPGCGNGGLSWEEVKPICERHFTTDDFIVVWR